MVFACQKDSFLKQFDSTVVSCKERQLKTVIDGKKVSLSGYDVILDDTILFPEGGGQPCDHGKINEIRIENVKREGAIAVHFSESPFKEGECVTMQIDWDRRFDHMQQHSGQHLITAVADREFGFSTTSWWLGKEISHIELDTPTMKNEEVQKLEELVNEYIRNATPVTVNTYGEENPIPKEVRTRGLPEDHVGDVRVVTIEGLENNMCCGTHVTNLSQLQVIKLVRVEKGKKGKVNLEFLVGSRVLKQMAAMYDREQAISNLLKNSPAGHVEQVDKLQKSLKVANKNLQTVLKDLAAYTARELLSQSPRPKYYCLHRKEADPDFMSIFINEVNNQDILLFLTIGDELGAGQLVLHGAPEIVSQLGPQICEVLEGKGAGKGPKYQAKVKSLKLRNKAIELIEKYFE
ncbi:alanyl-tRNA editing protein Aarsd1 [Nilaparvata lugens]|uniref:alanyl-tRNA editing protein Aarsd1 n=1 Tax=Nilaparvata lugens TaxID=108931 RepID=UPI00193D1C2D|nr:alanyl-tRNA editing protein Aarsd1 [Nilaparvata lugens]